jgi:hypothetical protein
VATATAARALACALRTTLVHFSIRHGDKADATIILTALAVDLEGHKEVLADRACAEEDKEGWLSEARKTCAREEPRSSTSS